MFAKANDMRRNTSLALFANSLQTDPKVAVWMVPPVQRVSVGTRLAQANENLHAKLAPRGKKVPTLLEYYEMAEVMPQKADHSLEIANYSTLDAPLLDYIMNFQRRGYSYSYPKPELVKQIHESRSYIAPNTTSNMVIKLGAEEFKVPCSSSSLPASTGESSTLGYRLLLE